jgi:hypothetical protein
VQIEILARINPPGRLWSGPASIDLIVDGKQSEGIKFILNGRGFNSTVYFLEKNSKLIIELTFQEKKCNEVTHVVRFKLKSFYKTS